MSSLITQAGYYEKKFLYLFMLNQFWRNFYLLRNSSVPKV